MPTAQRIKGQEVTVIIVRDGNLEAEMTDIMNFEVSDEYEIKVQGFLGETTNRHDYIFNGCKGSMEMQLHSQQWFLLKKAIKDKARRVTPDTEINISATLFFPNGETPSVLMPNVSFGPLPTNVSARGDYVKVKLEFAVDDDDVQTS